MTTAVKTVTLELAILYCDGAVFLHNHTDVVAATREYGELLAEAIEPTMTAPEARHVRHISLQGYDEFDLQTQYVHTPTFGCRHRPK